MLDHLEIQPVATLLAVVITLVGAAVVLFGHGLDFHEYLSEEKWLIGFLAVGRGLGASQRLPSSLKSHRRRR